MRQTLAQHEISALNERARQVAAASGASDAGDLAEALQKTARDAGLTLVTNDDQAAIYRDEAGRLVNCWLDVGSGLIEDGGLGFDDQVAWYTETL